MNRMHSARCTRRHAAFAIVAVGLFCGISVASAAEVADLRCEYRSGPLGIDVATPRLSWRIEDGGPRTEVRDQRPEVRGQMQSAYQVLVASTPELLANDQGDLWDSGKVDSAQSIQVEYAGKRLESRQACHWKARVWLGDGKALDWSAPAAWTMGLLKPGDWHAQWVGMDLADASVDPKDKEKRRLPARYLRREFVADKEIKRAMAYVCGLGVFDLHINGRKIV